ncbi:MAG: hypothetical protein J6O41_06105 [Clostridia bacterium]|nr:hypothetical protein [Clostridia bacterium]
MQDAMKQLEEMEKQLQTNQQATSALALKYREANAQLQAKTAEALNYKTQLDEIASGKRDKNGNLIKNQNNGGKNGNGGSLNRKRVEEVYDLINRGVVGNEPERTPNLRNKGYSDREIIAGQALINHAYPIELRGLE